MKHMGGFDDITPGRAVDGITAVQVRAWHIVKCPVGSIPQDPDGGWGIAERIGAGVSPGDIKTEEQIGRAALKRDPEIKDAAVTITEVSAGRYKVKLRLETVRGIVDIERDLAG